MNCQPGRRRRATIALSGRQKPALTRAGDKPFGRPLQGPFLTAAARDAAHNQPEQGQKNGCSPGVEVALARNAFKAMRGQLP